MRYRFVRYWFKFTGRPWLNTDIPSKHFVPLQDVFKTSSRHVFKKSSRHVFKTSSRLVFKTSSRRLQDALRDVFKTSSRRLGRQKIITLKTCWRRLQDMCWRRLKDVLKTNKCLLGCFFKSFFFRVYKKGKIHTKLNHASKFT